MSDIMLIQPPSIGTYKEAGKAFQEVSSVPPLGLLYIAQYLILHGYSVRILDLSFKSISKNKFERLLEEEKPKIVGVSVLTEFYPSAIQIAKAVKQWGSETTIVFGGPHVTFVDREPLETGVVDIVVRHEGEITMLDLADRIIRGRGKKLSEINGITCATKNQSNETVIKRNPPRPLISNLDALPFPARHLIDLELYRYGGAMISSRGCPNKCIFCASGAMSGRRYRTRSPKNVIAEMHYLYYVLDYDVVSIVDDTMTAIPKRLKEICQLLINTNFEGTWTCESRVDAVSKDLLQKMLDAGCRFIQFGLESSDQHVLDAIRKEINIQEIENAVKWAREVGMEVKVSYIVGHHVDTPQSIQRTIDFVERLNDEYNIATPVSINTPFPGTYLYENANELGVKILSRNWADYTLDRCIMETPYLSKNDIQRWHYIAAEKWVRSQKSSAKRIPTPGGDKIFQKT